MKKSTNITLTKAASEDYDAEFIISSVNLDRDADTFSKAALSKVAKATSKMLALWQHRQDQPVGYWENLHFDGEKITASLKLASTNLGKMIKQLLSDDVPLGASVGFSVLDYDDNKQGGWEFKEVDMYECSVVSTPANADAQRIKAVAKSFGIDNPFDDAPTDDDQLINQMECHDLSIRAAAAIEKVSKPQTQSISKSRNHPMSIAEKIKAAQEELVALKDELVVATKSLEENSDSDSMELVETLADSIDAKTKSLETFQKAEASLARSAQPVEKAAVSGGAPAVVKSEHRKGGDADLLVKSAICTFEAYLKRVPVDSIVAERYRDDERVKAVTGMTTKSAQKPAMTNVAGWAEELTRESYGAFMDLLKPESVIPRLGLSTYNFDGYSSIKIPMRNSGATPNLAGAFRAEGAPIRVGAASLGSKTLTPKSLGVIGTFTNELFERSTPNIETLIREFMISDTAEALDKSFLSATVGSATVPAGIQNGIGAGNTAASGGSTAADITSDIRARLQAMAAANLGRRPVFVMHPSNAVGISLALTATGQLAFPTMQQNVLLGYPVVTSTNVPTTAVFLIDAAEVAFAGGAPMFMGTEVATIHEEDTSPAPIVGEGTGTAGATALTDVANPVRSLFQTNSSALRCMWEVDWAVLRAGSVQLITGATY